MLLTLHIWTAGRTHNRFHALAAMRFAHGWCSILSQNAGVVRICRFCGQKFAEIGGFCALFGVYFALFGPWRVMAAACREDLGASLGGEMGEAMSVRLDICTRVQRQIRSDRGVRGDICAVHPILGRDPGSSDVAQTLAREVRNGMPGLSPGMTSSMVVRSG